VKFYEEFFEIYLNPLQLMKFVVSLLISLLESIFK